MKYRLEKQQKREQIQVDFFEKIKVANIQLD